MTRLKTYLSTEPIYEESEFSLPARKPIRVENGVASIDVYGPLTRLPDANVNGTSYATLHEEFDAIPADTEYVVLNIDTCGGDMAGLVEIAARIENMPIPVYAVVKNGSTCFSSGYWIAAACTAIYATRSSMIGGIGSMIIIEDDSAIRKSIGLKTIVIHNKEAIHKGIGQDGYSDEDIKLLEATVEEAAAMFKAHVLDNRPFIDNTVFTADTYYAEKAKELGLIDAIF